MSLVQVVGGGVFGLAAVLELASRGYSVRLVDRGPLPEPRAASTDISKVFRIAYGADEPMIELAEEARRGWLERDEERRRMGLAPLYHETGVVIASLAPMQPGSFEHESWRQLRLRGYRLLRLGEMRARGRYPRCPESFADGFLLDEAGWLDGRAVVDDLRARAHGAGVEIRESTPVVSLIEQHGAVRGLRTAAGEVLEGDLTVLACGSWTAALLPELGGSLRQTYHPVWHLRPLVAADFAVDQFPVFTAEISRLGFYGFPLHPRSGVVKIGRHAQGVQVADDADLGVPREESRRLDRFLDRHLPALGGSEIVSSRLCPYCDSPDESFWIARHPRLDGLTVAAGDSGHGFKFAPVLGRLIADAVEGRAHALSERFAWRTEQRGRPGRDAMRRRF